MYEIIFYRNNKGFAPVLDYLQELQTNKSKDARIKANKILEYVKYLKKFGVFTLPSTIVKHLDGDIWELRPIRDRILFAALVNNKYILLHHFIKSTQKTPVREIEKAKKELADYLQRSEQNE